MPDSMKSKLALLLGMLLVGGCMAMAADRSDKSKPKWMHSLPVPSNSTFVYVTESAWAGSLADARKECFNGLLQNAGFEKGVSVQSDYTTREEEHSLVVNDREQDVTETHFYANSTIKGKEVELQGVKIDEYWERGADGRYYLTTLYARSQVDQRPRFDNVRLTTKYGASGLWRSAIVPGWGQMYKGSTVKGGIILGGTAALIGGIVYTDCMRSDYIKKIDKTHSAENKRAYASRSDNFATGRNVCIGALGALYIYNLIDAIVAPGARRVVTSPAGSRRFSYTVSPVVMEDRSFGLAMGVTF